MTAPQTKLRCISMDHEEGEAMGVIWAEPQGRQITRQHIGGLVCSYLDEMEDGDECTLIFRRMDMTKQQVEALPEI